MTAKEGIEYLQEKCVRNEPVFILKASDELAASTVLDWATRAEKRGVNEEKVRGAITVSAAMRAWPMQGLPD